MATVPANSPSADPAVFGAVGQVVNTAPPEAKTAEQVGERGNEKTRDGAKKRLRLSARFEGLGAGMKRVLRQTPSWLASLIVHTVALVALGLWYIEPPKSSTELAIVADSSTIEESLVDSEKIQPEELSSFDSSMSLVESAPLEDAPLNPLAMDTDAEAMSLDITSLTDAVIPTTDLLNTTGVPGATGQGLGGRSGAVKGELLKRGGGNDASEAAVARALKWLAAHQLPDGGWSFDLKQCPTCNGRCTESGDGAQARLGATAMALLPFLGAGQTHKQGQYREVVRRGLYYLTTHTSNAGGFLSMHEPTGTMYSHGLGTIALCEAYAMTNDRSLAQYAQSSVDFIVYAQDPVGGGWRYRPRVEAGDTSVVGWQLMALKSAQMAGLKVPDLVYTRTSKFLDSVQSEDGAAYGYQSPSPAYRPGTSSVGVLSRMYLGWKKDNPALRRGVENLSRRGPSMPSRTNNRADMYYNYYATQVLRHWGGNDFDQWNAKMRDFLVESQNREGHEAGSWYFDFDFHTRVGGRLYCTAMSTMILEVYYRHLPLYGGKAVDDEFSRKPTK